MSFAPVSLDFLHGRFGRGTLAPVDHNGHALTGTSDDEKCY